MVDTGELQEAIYVALNGNITGGVYDDVDVPEDESPPYTTIGELTEGPDDTHTDEGSNLTITLHTWDNASSSSRVHTILRETKQALHRMTFTLDDGSLAYMVREFVQVLTDESEPGKPWRHAVQRYRVRTQEGA